MRQPRHAMGVWRLEGGLLAVSLLRLGLSPLNWGARSFANLGGQNAESPALLLESTKPMRMQAQPLRSEAIDRGFPLNEGIEAIWINSPKRTREMLWQYMGIKGLSGAILVGTLLHRAGRVKHQKLLGIRNDHLFLPQTAGDHMSASKRSPIFVDSALLFEKPPSLAKCTTIPIFRPTQNGTAPWDIPGWCSPDRPTCGLVSSQSPPSAKAHKVS